MVLSPDKDKEAILLYRFTLDSPRTQALPTNNSPSSSTMSSPPQTPAPSSLFQSILDIALTEYKKKAKNDLLDSWLAKELQSCESVEGVLDKIQEQAEGFDKFRNGDNWLMKWIGLSVGVLHKVSSILGEAAGTVRTIRDGMSCVVRSLRSSILM